MSSHCYWKQNYSLGLALNFFLYFRSVCMTHKSLFSKYTATHTLFALIQLPTTLINHLYNCYLHLQTTFVSSLLDCDEFGLRVSFWNFDLHIIIVDLVTNRTRHTWELTYNVRVLIFCISLANSEHCYSITLVLFWYLRFWSTTCSMCL